MLAGLAMDDGRRERVALAAARLFFAVGLMLQVVFLATLRDDGAGGWARHSAFWRGLFHDGAINKGADFFSIYHAGHCALTGRSLYPIEGAGPDPAVVPAYASGYRYLPGPAWTLGIALRGLGALTSPWTAFKVWVLLLEALLLFNAALCLRARGALVRRWLAAGLWLWFFPLVVELRAGQFSIPMATLILLTLWALRDGRPRVAGLWWALSVCLKQFTLITLPAWAVRRRWVALGLLAAGLAITALPHYLAYPRDWDYFRMINFSRHLGQGADVLYKGMLGFQQLGGWLFAALLPPEGARWAMRAVSTALLGLTLAATLRRGTDETAAQLLWLTLFFLVYRDIWENHYLMLLPVLCVALLDERLPVALVLAVFAVIALPTPYALLGGATADHFESGWAAWQSLAHHAPKPLATLALYAALWRSVWRADRARG